jgi:hypothetical protein
MKLDADSVDCNKNQNKSERSEYNYPLIERSIHRRVDRRLENAESTAVAYAGCQTISICCTESLG